MAEFSLYSLVIDAASSPRICKTLPGDNAEYETTMAVTYAKLIVDGAEIFEIDVLENIYKVGSADILSKYKSNIGG